MANEKLFRIEWDDELWAELESVFLDHVQTPDGRSVERGDMEGSSRHEAMADNFSEYGTQPAAAGSMAIPVNLQKLRQNIADSENASSPVAMEHIQGTQKMDPAASRLDDLQSDFVPATPSSSTIQGDNAVMRGVGTDNFSLSYVQSPVNFANVRNLSPSRGRSMIEADSGSDIFSSESGSAGGQKPIPEKKENNTLALQQTVRQVVEEKLSELKVYVLESDITDAQQAVKAVVKQATF